MASIVWPNRESLNMLTVGMNYQVLPGREKDFEDVFAGVLKVMADISGHTKSHLYRDVFDSSSYVIISDWSDREAFDGFIQSERFKNVANWGKTQVLAGRPSHQYYEQ